MGVVLDAVGLGTPDAPDPYATAAAQSKANREALLGSAQINQMGINMPGYNISYTGEIGDPNRTMNYELSPEKQQLADMISGGVNSIGAGTNFMPDFSGVPALPGQFDYRKEGQMVDDATFNAIQSRLQPIQQREYDRAQTDLNVSGNPMGSEGYGWQMDRLSDRQFDQNLQATMAGINAGRQEESRLFGQGMATNQQGNANVAIRNQLPMSNLAQLLSLDPTNASAPGQPTYQMAPPDIAGLIQNNYAIESGRQNAMLGGLAGLGGAALMAPVGTFSDRRLKHNIRRVGTMGSGLPVYEFSYKGFDDRFIGVMAQDVIIVNPDAVIETDAGFYAVNYGML